MSCQDPNGVRCIQPWFVKMARILSIVPTLVPYILALSELPGIPQISALVRVIKIEKEPSIMKTRWISHVRSVNFLTTTLLLRHPLVLEDPAIAAER